ncbi:MAG: VTT domain-containing protein [Kiritimatiellia bacterium]
MKIVRSIPRTVWLLIAVACLIVIPFICFEASINAALDRVMALSDNAPWRVGGVLFGALALDIVLPIPSSLVSTWCGMFFGLWEGFFISFMAMNVSCVLGWIIGSKCSGIAQRLIGEREFSALRAFITRYGVTVLIALRAVPVLAEASVLFAGVAQLPARQSMLFLVLGDAAVSFAYAWVGSMGRASDAMMPAFLASMALSALLLLLAKVLRPRRDSNATR